MLWERKEISEKMDKFTGNFSNTGYKAVNKNPAQPAFMMYFWQHLPVLLSQGLTTHSPGLSFIREFGVWSSNTKHTPCTPSMHLMSHQQTTKEGPGNLQDVMLVSNISHSKPFPGFATRRCPAGVWKSLSSERESPALLCPRGPGFSSLMAEPCGSGLKHNLLPTGGKHYCSPLCATTGSSHGLLSPAAEVQRSLPHSPARASQCCCLCDSIKLLI